MKLTCPVIQDQHEVAKTTRSLARAIQRLNRDRRLCATCPANHACPTAQALNAVIQTALDEVALQWEAAGRQPDRD